MDVIGRNVDYLTLVVVVAVIVSLLLRWLKVHGQASVAPRFVWISTVLILVIGAFAIRDAGDAAARSIEHMIAGYAPTYAAELKRLGHARITARSSPSSPEYQAAIDAEKRWLTVNQGINDIYTMRREASGEIRFVVDSETDYDRNGVYQGEREARTKIGELFELDNPALTAAFSGQGGVAAEPYRDRWGVWISAFWPIEDDAGNVDAVVGVDYDASNWLGAIAAARMGVIWIVSAFLVLFLAAVAVVALLRSRLRQQAEAQAALQRAKEAAESSSVLKGQFLALMSHELRTPINGIMGLAELLAREPLNDKQKRYTTLLGGSAETLLTLITDMLDYSQSTDDDTVDQRRFSVHELLADSVQLERQRATAKGLRFELAVEPSVPTELEGDPVRLRQVVSRLVNNAVKFTELGSVQINVSYNQEKQQLRCEVRDTGPGIDAETRRRLFEPFVQGDGSMSRRHGGTGLGLAICRRLVRSMDGEIQQEPLAGGGSLFWFEASLRCPPSAQRSEAA